jgi:glycosyltransferase involved in cell wall biosynthesis
MLHNIRVNPGISVIIPNYNGSATIGTCLSSLFSSNYPNFEVIVVDDFSTDGSIEVIRQFPCRLICLQQHRGASIARNTGAGDSSEEVLFFIDADCVVSVDTLGLAAKAWADNKNSVIGGSYARTAYDNSFYSNFQAVLINYSELKYREPDYVASHAMVMSKEVFEKNMGFPEEFMPVMEDVEFSHRLRRSGTSLIMDSSIIVRHIFNYSFRESFRNAFKKAKYWTAYSLNNKDLTKDSGAASVELKFSVLSACLTYIFFLCFLISFNAFFPACMITVFMFNLWLSRGLIKAFFSPINRSFGIKATLYFFLAYPLPVAAGGAAGMLYCLQSRTGRR